jgi:hypothetical protein
VDRAREVTHLQRLATLTLTAALAALLASTARSQGLGYSIWEETPAEHKPVASFLGHTGLVHIPSALVGRPLAVQSFAHRIDTDYRAGTREEDLFIWGANVAVTGNLELNAARLENVLVGAGTDAHFEDQTVLGGKYNLDLGRWTHNPLAPELAIGVWDASDEINRAYYVVLTKQISLREPEGPADLTLTLGFGNNEANRGALDGVFGGVEFVVAPMFRLQVEYDGEDVNGCLRFFPTRNLSLDIAGFDDFNVLGLGATYRVGF